MHNCVLNGSSMLWRLGLYWRLFTVDTDDVTFRDKLDNRYLSSSNTGTTCSSDCALHNEGMDTTSASRVSSTHYHMVRLPKHWWTECPIGAHQKEFLCWSVWSISNGRPLPNVKVVARFSYEDLLMGRIDTKKTTKKRFKKWNKHKSEGEFVPDDDGAGGSQHQRKHSTVVWPHFDYVKSLLKSKGSSRFLKRWEFGTSEGCKLSRRVVS